MTDTAKSDELMQTIQEKNLDKIMAFKLVEELITVEHLQTAQNIYDETPMKLFSIPQLILNKLKENACPEVLAQFEATQAKGEQAARIDAQRASATSLSR